MGDKITKEQIRLIERRIRREIAIEEGYYDGRNRPTIHTDKKKESSRRKCRGQQPQQEEQ